MDTNTWFLIIVAALHLCLTGITIRSKQLDWRYVAAINIGIIGGKLLHVFVSPPLALILLSVTVLVMWVTDRRGSISVPLLIVNLVSAAMITFGINGIAL